MPAGIFQTTNVDPATKPVQSVISDENGLIDPGPMSPAVAPSYTALSSRTPSAGRGTTSFGMSAPTAC